MTEKTEDKKLEEMQKALDAALGQIEALTGDLDKYKGKLEAQEKVVKKKEREAREAADKAEEVARQTGDMEALEKSYKEKFERYEDDLKAKEQVIYDVTVSAKASELAHDLALDGSADVLMPHIKSRLYLDMVDGQPVIKVSTDGKPSASSVEDLKTEFSENKAFAPLIKGSAASGAGSASPGGNGAAGRTINRSEFDKMNPLQQGQFMNDNKNAVVD